MGFDVYVGTLTRYYVRYWETVMQRIDHEQVPEQAGPATSQDEVRRSVLMWRDALSAGLQAHLQDALDWDESADAPCFTGELDWESYAGLLVWAAYAEHPDLPRPHGAITEWEADPAYQASTAGEHPSHYGQMLHGPELWLPCEFEFTFRAEDACGNEIGIGSATALLAELKALNAATWAADAATLAAWRRTGAPQAEATLEEWARHGFAVFLGLAERAVAHGLPMKLDY